jgi:CheY-like chemotaxis protein
LCHIPIIALTAHAMSGDEARAKAVGCDDYLSKPIDEDLLFTKLHTFLGND